MSKKLRAGKGRLENDDGVKMCGGTCVRTLKAFSLAGDVREH